jgi:hypothetical protein
MQRTNAKYEYDLKTSLVSAIKNWLNWLEDKFHVLNLIAKNVF